MPFCPKIVLHSKQSYQPDLDALIGRFINDQVHLVCVVGADCQRIEDIIDGLCVGDGMLWHNSNFRTEKDREFYQALIQ